MIDIEDDRAKQRIRIELVRIMARMERGFIIKLKSILRKQYIESSVAIRGGDLNINFIVNKYQKELLVLFENQYRKIVTVFSKKAFQEIEKQIKSPLDDFWTEIYTWIRMESFDKAIMINRSTKRILRTILLKGMSNGLSHFEIADKIRKAGNIATTARARTIARTETHAAANKSINTAMKTTRLMKEREWISAFDERTRQTPFDHVYANGERIPFGGFYQNTGEHLKFPGDSRGRAGNVINCRCSELFYTKQKVGVA